MNPAPDLGKTIAGRYKIAEVIGEGGMGVVYGAWDTQVSRNVAIKVVRSGITDRKYLKRFRREVEVTSQLRHPSTIRVFEHGQTEDGRLFMVMERLTGQSLADRLDQGPLSELEALQTALHVAESLSEAHEHGVFHRDLKPDNIFIETVGVSKVVKVLDFGIAGGVDATRLTQAGEVFGTPQYMSPEQCSGQRLDHRTDIYSLACILHEMIEGRPPFVAESPMATMLKHVRSKVAPMRRASPQTAAVVSLGLKKDRGKRIQTAGKFAELLQDCIQSAYAAVKDDRPRSAPLPSGRASAPPPAAPTGPRRRTDPAGHSRSTSSILVDERRNKVLAVSLGVTVLALIGGIVFGNLGAKASSDLGLSTSLDPDRPLNRALVRPAVRGAGVFVDGEQQCTTPCWIRVPVGGDTPHSIRVSKSGYGDVTTEWAPQTVTEPLPELPPLVKAP